MSILWGTEVTEKTIAASTSATSGLQGDNLEGSSPDTKHRKVSKTEANYVSFGETDQHRQSCTMFMKPDACTKVRGKIGSLQVLRRHRAQGSIQY